MKKLSLLLSISCLTSAVFAADVVPSPLQVKLEGVFDFQSGFRNQSKLEGKDKMVSANRGGFAFKTTAAFLTTITNTVDDINYGAKIVLVPTSKVKGGPNYNGSHLFLESDYGRTEIGAPHDASAKMRVMADDTAAASGAGGGWSDYAKLDGENVKHGDMDPGFVGSADYFFDTSFKTKAGQINDGTEPARKISYYTPKVSGFQAGISYIPDSSNVGGRGISIEDGAKSGITKVALPGPKDQHFMEVNQNVKDAFAAGATYEYNISDGVDVKIGVTGEYGKSARKLKETNTTNTPETTEYKLSNLKTYNIGAALTFGNFSYAASYGSLGKSLTAKEYHKTGRDTNYYNGAIAYGQGPIKASVSYFKSKRFKNTVDVVAIGTEYKMLPGLLPYAEIAYFQAKGKPVFYPEAQKKKIKGTVAIVGARLKF